MHSTTHTPTKLTPTLPPPFPESSNSLPATPQQFRTQAIIILNTAIAQRKAIIKRGKSHLLITPEIVSVFNMFDAYKYTWSVRGIIYFITTRANLIRLIIPGSNPILLQRFNDLLTTTETIKP